MFISSTTCQSTYDVCLIADIDYLPTIRNNPLLWKRKSSHGRSSVELQLQPREYHAPPRPESILFVHKYCLESKLETLSVQGSPSPWGNSVTSPSFKATWPAPRVGKEAKDAVVAAIFAFPGSAGSTIANTRNKVRIANGRRHG